MAILKLGSRGEAVKLLQRYLGLSDDGIFGQITKYEVKKFQKNAGLKPDGIVGRKTWEFLKLASTDNTETYYQTESGLFIKAYHMDQDEYVNEITNKDYVFIHDTAGWNNPFAQVDGWNNDKRGRIGTEFIIGGQNIKNNDDAYDGEVLSTFPQGHYAWHLGRNGSQYMHEHSVGIELCAFGYLQDGRAWQGTRAHSRQICTLKKPFRGYKKYHRYSNRQIEKLSMLLKHIGDRDNIDVRDGLPKWIKKEGVKAFEFKADAFFGRVRGTLSHTNTRNDKFDCFPQPELIDMLVSL